MAIDLSGDSFGRLLYASQLVALLLALLFVGLPPDGFAGIFLALLFGLLVLATIGGLWRKRIGREGGTHPGTAEDITHDPIADPGQAAKNRWQQAVDRLPDGDDERD